MLHEFLCFFFKRKTAYVMRICDWSSDVCSSDLCLLEGADLADAVAFEQARLDAEQLRLQAVGVHGGAVQRDEGGRGAVPRRSEEHTSELQSLMRISYAVFCLKKKKKHNTLYQ